MDFTQIEEKYKDLIELAKYYMSKIVDHEHDINHMFDVVNFTKELLINLDGEVDCEVSIIAAYWHDVGRTKINQGHEELSAKMLKEVMEEKHYDEVFINKCYNAILYHKWNMQPTTLEGRVIKDADKLAWLGLGRWNSCLKNGQRLDELIKLLPRLKQEILYFEESKKIYDREIVNLIKLLYDNIYK